MKKIVLTGGGTAGHVTPHFALLPYIIKHFDEVYYVGTKNSIEEKLVKENNINFYPITATKLIRGFNLSNLKIPFRLVKSVNEASKILKEIKPNVVFSKGGFVALPVTMAAKNLKIPVILHESDMSLGLANSLALPYADKLLTTFEKTKNNSKKSEFVGAIIRKDLFSVSKADALKYYGFKGDKPVILITGGSQGARVINDSVIKILPQILTSYNVLHLTGKGNLTSANFNGYKQVEFTDMKYAYALCDFAVSRAGSNTAFELLTKKIPTIFIPLPKGNSRGDQVENAKFFSEKGVCFTLNQQDITPKILLDSIQNLTKNSNKIITNLTNFNYPIANNKIAKILCKY